MIAAWADLAMPLVRALDPERAHHLAVAALKVLPAGRPAPDDPRLATEAFGLRFANPVGLAAGFDKQGEVADALLGFGFGFVEVGGVTPLPQPGNPRPRAFRLAADRALVNRYGLNSDGMEAVAGRLAARRGRPGIVAVNLAPNKDTADRAGDFERLARRFAPLAALLTVNISSPNTKGLRDLQAEAALDDLLARTLAARDEACRSLPRPTPLLVKIAPDLGEADLDGIVAAARRRGIDGMIVSNTTVARPATLRGPAARETGGLSGRPLFAPSTRVLAQTFLRVEGAFPLVGVGGIDSPEAAWTKIEAGATLVQLYTGLVYEGPGLVARIKRGLAERLAEERLSGLAPVIGRRAGELAQQAAG